MCGCVGQHQHIATTALVGNKRGGELRIDQISEEAAFISVSTFKTDRVQFILRKILRRIKVMIIAVCKSQILLKLF